MKITVFFVFLAFCCFTTVNSQNFVKASQETLANLHTLLVQEIRGNRALLGGFVRLSFHDCVGQGRCDGCIDHNNPDNNGLLAYTTVLDALYNESFSSLITRADLYAYAGVVAANFASTNNVFDTTRFRVGRRDCSQTGVETDTNENFPSPNLENVNQIHAFFEEEFDLTLRQSVALMGAHSLGRMRTKNSGYEGPWVPGGRGPEVLDNVYYREVVNVPWFLKVMPTNDDKHQWQRRAPSLGVGNSADGGNPIPDNVLLNTDAALAVNLHLEENGSFEAGTECVMCPSGRRPPPGGIPCCDEDTEGRPICVDYADDNGLFLNDFETSFYKMIDSPGVKVEGIDLSLPVAEATTPAPTVTRRPGGGGGRGGGGGGRGGGGGGGGRGGRGDEMMMMDKVEQTIEKLMKDLEEVKDEVKRRT